MNKKTDFELEKFNYVNGILDDNELTIENKQEIIKELLSKGFYNSGDEKHIESDKLSGVIKALMSNELVTHDNLKDFMPHHMKNIHDKYLLLENIINIPSLENFDIRKIDIIRQYFHNIITPTNINKNVPADVLIHVLVNYFSVGYHFYQKKDISSELITEILKGKEKKGYIYIINNLYKPDKFDDNHQELFASLLFNKLNSNNIKSSLVNNDNLNIALETLILNNSPLLLEHKLIINHFNFYDFYLELIDYAKNEQFEYEDLDDCNKVNADVLEEYLFQLLNNDKLSITADRRIIKNYFDNDKINSLYKSAIENNNYKMIDCCEKYFKKVNSETLNSETLNSEVKEKTVGSNKKRKY